MAKENIEFQAQRHPLLDGLAALTWESEDARVFFSAVAEDSFSRGGANLSLPLETEPREETRSWHESVRFVEESRLTGRVRTLAFRLYYGRLINSLGDITQLTDNQLLRVKNVGPVTLLNVRKLFPFTPADSRT